MKKKIYSIKINKKTQKFFFKKIFFHVSEGEKSEKKIIESKLEELNPIKEILYRLKTTLYFCLKLDKTIEKSFKQEEDTELSESLKTLLNLWETNYKSNYIETITKYNKSIFKTEKQFNNIISKIKRGKNKIYNEYNNLKKKYIYIKYQYNLNKNWYNYKYKFSFLKWIQVIYGRVELIIQYANFIDNIYFLHYLLLNSVFAINNICINSFTYIVKKDDYIIILSSFRYLIYKLIVLKFSYDLWKLLWYIFIILNDIIYKILIQIKKK